MKKEKKEKKKKKKVGQKFTGKWKNECDRIEVYVYRRIKILFFVQKKQWYSQIKYILK